MNEAYIEQLVKRKTSLGQNIFKNLFIFLTVVALLAGLLLYPIFLVTAVVFGIFSYFSIMNADIEYEYLLVDRELTIDVIRAKSKRKTIANYQLDHMEVFAPDGSKHLEEFQNKKLKVRDFSSHFEDSNPYVLVCGGKNNTEMIVLEGNDELYKNIYMIAPRKVFKD